MARASRPTFREGGRGEGETTPSFPRRNLQDALLSIFPSFKGFSRRFRFVEINRPPPLPPSPFFLSFSASSSRVERIVRTTVHRRRYRRGRGGEGGRDGNEFGEKAISARPPGRGRCARESDGVCVAMRLRPYMHIHKCVLSRKGQGGGETTKREQGEYRERERDGAFVCTVHDQGPLAYSKRAASLHLEECGNRLSRSCISILPSDTEGRAAQNRARRARDNGRQRGERVGE